MTNQNYTFSEVQQTSQIFNDTLLFNLTLGKKFDDFKITEAIKRLDYCHMLIGMA